MLSEEAKAIPVAEGVVTNLGEASVPLTDITKDDEALVFPGRRHTAHCQENVAKFREIEILHKSEIHFREAVIKTEHDTGADSLCSILTRFNTRGPMKNTVSRLECRAAG